MPSKCKYSKEQREDFLREHGFIKAREAAGDHSIWVHAELRNLAKSQNLRLECPQNLLSNVAQLPWENTVPMNPATGTWTKIANHAKWCDAKATEIKGAAAAEAARRQRKQEFLEAREEICVWKHEAKHRFRAGLEAKPAPASYHRMNDIKARL